VAVAKGGVSVSSDDSDGYTFDDDEPPAPKYSEVKRSLLGTPSSSRDSDFASSNSVPKATIAQEGDGYTLDNEPPPAKVTQVKRSLLGTPSPVGSSSSLAAPSSQASSKLSFSDDEDKGDEGDVDGYLMDNETPPPKVSMQKKTPTKSSAPSSVAPSYIVPASVASSSLSSGYLLEEEPVSSGASSSPKRSALGSARADPEPAISLPSAKKVAAPAEAVAAEKVPQSTNLQLQCTPVRQEITYEIKSSVQAMISIGAAGAKMHSDTISLEDFSSSLIDRY
jgi:hypothetical protein